MMVPFYATVTSNGNVVDIYASFYKFSMTYFVFKNLEILCRVLNRNSVLDQCLFTQHEFIMIMGLALCVHSRRKVDCPFGIQ